jgi:ATP-dependent DNA helicase RecG
MYVKEKGSINLSSFKAIVPEVSEKTLYRDLQELVSKGVLKELGEKKGRRYELL